MRVPRLGEEKGIFTRVARAAWFCSLIGLFIVALPAGIGGRVSLAQTEQAQTDDPPVAVPAPEAATAVPSPPSANSKPKPKATPDAPKLESVTTEPESVTTVASAPTPPAKPLDANQKAVADASASLLEMANSLKKEVDKTSADTLSVAVVRKAGEIEQLARKLRGGQ
jgi:hypothetical protein